MTSLCIDMLSGLLHKEIEKLVIIKPFQHIIFQYCLCIISDGEVAGDYFPIHPIKLPHHSVLH